MTRYLAAIQAVTAITSAMLAALVACLPGFGETVEPATRAAQFKLHVHRDYQLPSDMGVVSDLRGTAKVDPRIIKAITEARSALPSWNGLHHMVSAASNN